MAKEIIGTIKCAHCGNPDATVHHQKSSGSLLYYRCYESPNSLTARCGTIQCLGPDGQKYINENMVRPVADVEKNPIGSEDNNRTGEPSLFSTFIKSFSEA